MAVDLAIAVHRHLAGDDQSAAFASRGFTTADIERALRIATTPLAVQEADEARAGAVLLALRAPGLSLVQELREIITDEAPPERLARLEDAGFFEAVVHHAERALPRADDAEAYARGRSAFLAALQAERVAA